MTASRRPVWVSALRYAVLGLVSVCVGTAGVMVASVYFRRRYDEVSSPPEVVTSS